MHSCGLNDSGHREGAVFQKQKGCLITIGPRNKKLEDGIRVMGRKVSFGDRKQHFNPAGEEERMHGDKDTFVRGAEMY